MGFKKPQSARSDSNLVSQLRHFCGPGLAVLGAVREPSRQNMRTFIVASAILVCLLLVTSADASTFILTPATPGLTFTLDNLGLAATDLYIADGTNDTYELRLTLTTTTDYVNA